MLSCTACIALSSLLLSLLLPYGIINLLLLICYYYSLLGLGPGFRPIFIHSLGLSTLTNLQLLLLLFIYCSPRTRLRTGPTHLRTRPDPRQIPRGHTVPCGRGCSSVITRYHGVDLNLTPKQYFSPHSTSTMLYSPSAVLLVTAC